MQPFPCPSLSGSGPDLISDSVAAAAALISLIALIFSIWTMWIQREHNRKSVRAVGSIDLQHSRQQMTVKIVNKGCGPMEIRELIAEREGIAHHNLLKHMPSELRDFREARSAAHLAVHSKPEGEWLLPGGELILLKVEGDDRDQLFAAMRDSIRSVLAGITIKLVFSDIYDTKYPAAEKALIFFSTEPYV
jgi:hypothetical protein